MYCSSCGAAVAQGLSFCNHCGAKLGGAEDERAAGPAEVKPGLLVSAIVGGFVLGLLAIAVLVGVLKAVAGFDLPFLLAATMLSFLLLLTVEGVLIGLLLKARRGGRGAPGAALREGQATGELAGSQARALQEPLPSVTEQTTRTLDPVFDRRRAK